MRQGRPTGFGWARFGWHEGWFLGRRMRSAALLLSGVALAAFVTAAAATAAVTFAVQVLPQGAAGQLARLPGTWVGAIGLVDAPTMTSDTAAIRTQLRDDLGGVPFALYSTAWSAPLKLRTAAKQSIAGAEIAAAAQLPAEATLVAGSWPGDGG